MTPHRRGACHHLGRVSTLRRRWAGPLAGWLVGPKFQNFQNNIIENFESVDIFLLVISSDLLKILSKFRVLEILKILEIQNFQNFQNSKIFKISTTAKYRNFQNSIIFKIL